MPDSPKQQESETEAWAFSADRPIPSRKEDRFQRAGFADALVTQVLALPKSDSFVLGLIGPWGSGKTSVLSMVEEAVAARDDVVVLKFNPWLFSGAEQLAAHFFQELAAQLHELGDKRLQQTGDLLVGYSEALSPLSALPFIGKWAERLAGGAKFLGGSLDAKVAPYQRVSRHSVARSRSCSPSTASGCSSSSTTSIDCPRPTSASCSSWYA